MTTEPHQYACDTRAVAPPQTQEPAADRLGRLLPATAQQAGGQGVREV
ncbi:hypothetical protein ABZ667_10910 [Streptomyces lavendulae]